MYRYLLNVSYIGTNFRGIQKTVNKLEKHVLDKSTVQGCIELALRVLRPVNEIKTVLSSRTDSGVHALHSTLHVDLRRSNDEPYDTETITGVLNRTLDRERLAIRILSTQIVPETFHCRYNTTGRTYLYRLAVSARPQALSDFTRNKYFGEYIPIEELNRCHFFHVRQFEIERVRQAASMFLGRHDFRTFMSTNHQKGPSRDNPMFTVRTITKINIEPGKALALRENSIEAERIFNYWDIEITGKSFVYKQIRRIVGTLIALGIGRIDEKIIYEMLTIPSKYSWYPRIALSPAYGLYLRKVHYDPKDLQLTKV